MGTSDNLTGTWTGIYDYDNVAFGAPVSFDATLIETAGLLQGDIMEPNTFRSQSLDSLLAVISGMRTGSSVHFVKTYTNFDAPENPVYDGTVNATATRITGRWHFPSQPNIKGTFLLARTQQAAARKTTTNKAEATLERVR